MIVLGNWLSFPVGWIQLFKLGAISIQTQYKTAIQLPIHPQPHLDWPVSSSLWIFSLQKMEKRYSSFFWISPWSADRRATRNMVFSTSIRISIETLKLDDIVLMISLMFLFLPECFAYSVERKSGNPAVWKWFQDH